MLTQQQRYYIDKAQHWLALAIERELRTDNPNPILAMQCLDRACHYELKAFPIRPLLPKASKDYIDFPQVVSIGRVLH